MNRYAFGMLAAGLIAACILLLTAVIITFTPMMEYNPGGVVALTGELAESAGGCLIVGIVLCVLLDVIAKHDGLEEKAEKIDKNKKG